MQIVIDIPESIIDDDFGYMDIRLHKDRDHINKATTAISGNPYFTYLDFVVLPKGHGRLIDADEFSKTIKGAIQSCRYESLPLDKLLTVADVLNAVISELDGTSLDGFKNAPTIIEADM